MPYDSPEPTDPLELRGVALPVDQAAIADMGRVFAEEFLRLGWSASRVVAMFRDPRYRAPHQVFRVLGEAAVTGMVNEIAPLFARCHSGPTPVP